MAHSRSMARPSRESMIVQGIEQTVEFADGRRETYVLAPGQIVADVLRQQGIDQEYILIPRNSRT